MRRQMLVLLAVLLALATQPARAQFILSPRGIFGMVSAPLRDMLGHLRGLRHHYYRRHEARHRVVAARAVSPVPPDRSRLNAYDDVLGYAFWPGEYAAELNRYGYGDIALAIVGPLPAAPATDGSAATTGHNPASDHGMLPVCRNADASTGDWLSGRIEQALSLDAKQRRSFDRLRAKLATGAQAIRASCQAPLSDSPTTRLAELTQRLWAVHDANLLARHAIKRFYDSLSGKQKAKFDSAAPAHEAGKDVPASRRYRACAAQSAGASERLLRQIRQTVRPTRAQQASLDSLRKTSGHMEKLLLASCAQPVAKNPLARLDAANQRLVAMNLAATNMEVALNDFYAGLDPGQKAKFDSLGR